MLHVSSAIYIIVFYLLQCLFLIWCMVPSDYNGSVIIYNRIIRTLFLKHQASVDSGLETIKNAGLLFKEKDLMDHPYHENGIMTPALLL